MSKGIFLYSEDKKYKCAFELAETTDHFGCPDHSVMVLFEERDNGTYIIAQARDKRLETEKDTIIDDLKMHNADFVRELADAKNKIADLEAKLAQSKMNESFEKEKKDNAFKFIEELKQQLEEKNEEIKQLNNRILISQLQAPKEQILNILGSQCIQYNPDQDKIDYAVEQLEKVKGYFGELSLYEMYDKIDNQIKAIKEGK